ncbi:hypothetical protein DOZ80_18245 [Pseudomonas fluorescens]|uniref:Uncharacterized protein n=1 Tax=Pseudomonas fluorescens TaxID=294 RepID=A0A327N0C6_PSEFL|nr:hypothetical protein DOZ80_18245 [Pseudomonas fluorescens]
MNTSTQPAEGAGGSRSRAAGELTLDPVGASLLAMDVNDNAGCLNARGVPAFFVGTPPGASSLLQGNACN